MFGFRSLRPILLVGLLSIGCDSLALDHDLDMPAVTDLSDRFACADLILVAADPTGTEGLFLTIDDGLVDEVLESGEAIAAHYQVGDDRIEVRWVSGSNVYAGHCGLDNGEPWQVEQVEQAIAGDILVELMPSADGVRLAVELRDVLLAPLAAGQAKQGEARRLEPIILHDLEITG